MHNASQALVLLLAAVAVGSGCSSDSSGGDNTSSCPASDPIECRSPEGSLVGCCPESHPVCSMDGLECNAWSTGGAAGAASGGNGGTTGGTGGTTGGNGGTTGGTGGTTGGTGGTTGGTGGATGGTGGSGDTGNCTGPVVEPNDTEATAKHLGTISDCDLGKFVTVSDKLDGADDIDFFSLFGTDNAGCVVDPTASTTSQARLCMFADCPNLALTCSQGTAETSPGGRQGCCVSGGGTVKLSIDCKGVSDDATLYLRIDQGAAGQCTSYSIDYHY